MKAHKFLYFISGFFISALLSVFLLGNNNNNSADKELLIEFDSTLSGHGRNIAALMASQDKISESIKGNMQFSVKDEGKNVEIIFRLNHGDNYIGVLESVINSVKVNNLEKKIIRMHVNM
jgi:hypothetical protein